MKIVGVGKEVIVVVVVSRKDVTLWIYVNMSCLFISCLWYVQGLYLGWYNSNLAWLQGTTIENM